LAFLSWRLAATKLVQFGEAALDQVVLRIEVFVERVLDGPRGEGGGMSLCRLLRRGRHLSRHLR